MKKTSVFLLGLAGLSLLSCNLFSPKAPAPTPAPAPPLASPSDKFVLATLTAADGQRSDVLSTEAQRAKAQGLTLFVEFYADWCEPCQALSKSLGDGNHPGDPQMIAAFTGTYILRLNVDKWLDTPLGANFQVKTIPAFFALDAAGKPTGRTITGAAWGDNTPENMAPPLKAFFTANEW